MKDLKINQKVIKELLYILVRLYNKLEPRQIVRIVEARTVVNQISNF